MSEIKSKRDRSPAFPAIPLGDAVDKLAAFEKKFGRHPAPYDKAGMAWGLKQAGDYVAALRYYGFVEYAGTSTRDRLRSPRPVGTCFAFTKRPLKRSFCARPHCDRRK